MKTLIKIITTLVAVLCVAAFATILLYPKR